jgi:hypothetical protein
MTDMQEQSKSSIIAILARLERLCGPFPILTSEGRKDYQELLTSLLDNYRPTNFLGEKLVRHLADEEWEINRLRRHKVILLERRLRARLAYQACREKPENKAALAKNLAQQPLGYSMLPEEMFEDVVPNIDAVLDRPAQELGHARALERAIGYFERLERLLNAAIVRRAAILKDIEHHDFLFIPLHAALIEEAHGRDDGYGNESDESNARCDETAPALAPANGGQS